jgi:hypothetical protein
MGSRSVGQHFRRLAGAAVRVCARNLLKVGNLKVILEKLSDLLLGPTFAAFPILGFVERQQALVECYGFLRWTFHCLLIVGDDTDVMTQWHLIKLLENYAVGPFYRTFKT